MRASLVQRFGGWFIDVFFVLIVVGVGYGLGRWPLETAQGWRTDDIVLALYVALRDVAGASFGKWLLGLRVARADGGPSAVWQRVVRNLTLAVPLALNRVDMSNSAHIIIGLVLMADMIALLRTEVRLGDWLARTTVIVRSKTPKSL